MTEKEEKLILHRPSSWRKKFHLISLHENGRKKNFWVMKNVLFNGDRKMVKIYNQIIKEKKFGKFPSSSRLSSTNFFIAFKFTH